MNYLLTVLLIGLLILVHELGHLLAAWSVGIGVERFSVGFGPVVCRRRWRGVEYCLSLIPLGGYVLPRFESEEAFFRIPVARRMVMWAGGPLANFVFAGLVLGVINGMTREVSAFEILARPWLQVTEQSGLFLAALPTVFMHPDRLSGIVGIVAAGDSWVGGSLLNALRFAVLLNLNLAIFNLLPIAPLDGGKIVCGLLEKIHPKLARLQTGFSLVGLAAILLLVAYTTVMDVLRQLA